jgi:hypothetical protein
MWNGRAPVRVQQLVEMIMAWVHARRSDAFDVLVRQFGRYETATRAHTLAPVLIFGSAVAFSHDNRSRTHVHDARNVLPLRNLGNQTRIDRIARAFVYM